MRLLVIIILDKLLSSIARWIQNSAYTYAYQKTPDYGCFLMSVKLKEMKKTYIITGYIQTELGY